MITREDEIIGNRLKRARISLGLTLQDVATCLGFPNYQTLSSIEKGERSIKVSELARLCKIYFRTMSFFLSQDEIQENFLTFAWRNKESDISLSGIEASLRLIAENYDLLERVNGIPSGDFSFAWDASTDFSSYDDVYQKAEKIVDDFNLGYRPCVNLKEFMENSLGLRLVFYNLVNYGSGATLYNKDLNSFTIFINAYDTSGRRIFDLAHELFHVFSSNIYPLEKIDEYERDSGSQIEKYADAFASAFLLPKNSIFKEFDQFIGKDKSNVYNYIRVARQFGVSTQALIWRCVNLSLLEKDFASEFLKSEEFQLINSRERKSEAEPTKLFSYRFVWLSIHALRKGQISKGKFCQIFEIPRSRFGRFIEEFDCNEECIYNGESASIDS